MKWLLALLFISVSIQAQADMGSSELVRPLAGGATADRVYPVTRVAFEGAYTEGYVYSDIAQKTDHAQMIEILKYFDEKVYPKFVDTLAVDPLRGVRRQQKIILLFDSLKGLYPAYHSSKLYETHRDFILIDIDSAMNSNYVDYYLPHELQHIMRLHYNPNESRWLNEGLSKFAEYYENRQEFPIGYLDQYDTFTGAGLFYDYAQPDGGLNYFNDMFFVYYLYRHFGGIELIRKLMTSEKSGVEAINAALAEMRSRETDLSLVPFYTFEKAFTNYQLALLLNPESSTLESGGLWDLKFGADVSPKYGNFHVHAEQLPLGKLLKLKTMESRYFELDQKCINVTLAPRSQVMAALVDLNAKDRVLHVLSSGKSACVEALTGSGQFLVLINGNQRFEEPAALR